MRLPAARRASRHAQRGVSIWHIFVFFFLLFCALTLGDKIGFPYWNAHIIRQDIEKAFDDQKGADYYDADAIRQALYNRGQIDNLSIAPDTVLVRPQSDGSTVVTVPYVVQVPLWAHATLVLDLTQSAQRGGSGH
jgi:hypothetical protein